MSAAEDALVFQLRAAGLPDPVREYRFTTPHRWRFDLAWPAAMLAVEVEGGTWAGGRHTTGAGFEADCRKYNFAARHGWRVLRFTTGMVESGEALAIIQAALEGR